MTNHTNNRSCPFGQGTRNRLSRKIAQRDEEAARKASAAERQ
jgi:hypothetical protein